VTVSVMPPIMGLSFGLNESTYRYRYWHDIEHRDNGYIACLVLR